MAMVKSGTIGGGDATGWDEEIYRDSILLERELSSRTVFRTLFSPSPNPNPQTLAVASSDGSVAAYSVSSCVSGNPRPPNSNRKTGEQIVSDYVTAEPLCIVQAHKGPTYDLKFYGDGDDALLLSLSSSSYATVEMMATFVVGSGWNWTQRLKPI